ncbi:MAG: hypothetical protein AB1609_11045 [Bacillota bacterium]
MRLGIGGYATGDVQTEAAREMFLATIERDAPEVLRALRDEVYPYFSRDELQDRLTAWARRWHLCEPWILDKAMDTLALWDDCPALRAQEPPRWDAGGGFSWWEPVADAERRIAFEADGWDPAMETRGQARERLLRAFAEAVDRHLDHIATLAENRGWTQVVVKRNRSGEPDLHFKWLVQHRVLGWSVREIADRYMEEDPTGERVIGEDAIRKAIEAASKLIGLRSLRN